jgi:hypothetical protein
MKEFASRLLEEISVLPWNSDAYNQLHDNKNSGEASTSLFIAERIIVEIKANPL